MTKSTAWVMLIIFTYAVWILCVLTIQGNEVIYHNYPPAVVAMMVMGILQNLFIIGQIIWGKTRYFSALNVILGTVFFLLFNIGATVPATALRHKKSYCTPTSDHWGGDCRGRLKGTYGLAYALMVWDLIFIGHTVGLVWENKAKFSTPYGLIPGPARVGTDDPRAAEKPANGAPQSAA